MPATPRTMNVFLEDPKTHETLDAAEMQAQLDRIFWDDELKELPRMSFILDQWIPKGGLTMLTGHGNAGKTLVGLQWALSIVTGTPWSAKNKDGETEPYDVIEQGNVLYLTQEGITGLQPRREAWMALHEIERTKGFGAFPLGFKLGVAPQRATDETKERIEQGWNRLAELIEEADPVAVFVDPFADYLSPGDENDNNDVSEWVSRLRGMLNAGTSVVLMAHTSAANKQGGENRGATALYDGADRAYTITPIFPAENKTGQHIAKGNPVAMQVSCEKAKDGSRPSPWHAEFVQQPAPSAALNREGERVSVTLSPITMGEFIVHEQRSNQSFGTGVNPSQFEQFKALVLARDSITTTEAYDMMPKVNKNTVRGWLNRIDELESKGQGEYVLVGATREEPETL